MRQVRRTDPCNRRATWLVCSLSQQLAYTSLTFTENAAARFYGLAVGPSGSTVI